MEEAADIHMLFHVVKEFISKMFQYHKKVVIHLFVGLVNTTKQI